MFNHILVPLDLTDWNVKAIETAADLAALMQSRLTLVHVVESIAADADDGSLAAFYDSLEVRAHAAMDPVAARLVRQGLDAAVAIVRGKRADEIVRFAGEHAVDLIVMTSRRLDPSWQAAAWPTISHRVALVASQPVLLVREPPPVSDL